ncbi:TerC family protein [Caldibacillus lycopersici]|uniref:TerC family protein n=1 Tax=Perspicuibacillus lycopersici TaxID=1325689 RepID=A0AAE3LTT9_9BACI|nr:TerC family protein [Perspicuibacillus lycopersici]MCU9614503.1 TerC family protein [Perspicuibacillus lycopersici]
MDLALIWSSETLLSILQIIAIDIILSGDNAIVIAMATRKLPDNKRNMAILWGTGGAVVLRILFAGVIAILLKIPFVHFIGGLLLLWIAYKVLVNHEEEADIKAKDNLLQAIGTIIMADAVMSLDNVVAIAGASGGHVTLIAIGVLISIPIMIFCSKLIVRAMEKYAWIAYVGSGILAWTAGTMIIEDKEIAGWLNIEKGPITYVFAIIVTALVLIFGYLKNKKMEAAGSTSH